jgi:hypothetical protein
MQGQATLALALLAPSGRKSNSTGQGAAVASHDQRGAAKPPLRFPEVLLLVG